MAVRDMFRITRRTFFNPVGWIDFNTLSTQNRTIWTVLRGLFTTPRPVREETFEQAMERLKISESDVKQIAKTYRWYAITFSFLGLVVLIYAFYLLFHNATIAGFLLGLAAAALFFSQAFKFDFWSFQMRKRKLGLTYAQWKKNLIGKKGSVA